MYVRDFNTPKFQRQRGKDLNGLFRLVLGARVSTAIEDLLNEPNLCNSLDEIVTQRGEMLIPVRQLLRTNLQQILSDIIPLRSLRQPQLST